MDQIKKQLSHKKETSSAQPKAVQPKDASRKRRPPSHISISPKKSKTPIAITQKVSPATNELTNSKTLESYSLIEPFARAHIIKDLERGNIRYVLEEPELKPEDRSNLNRLKEILNQVITMKPSDLQSKETAGKYLLEESKEIFEKYSFKIDQTTQNKLLYYIARDNLGFGKIDALMHDPLIEDLSCDGVNVPMFVWHRKSESIPTNIRFETAEELDSFALRLAYMCGSHVSIAQPLIGCKFTRWQQNQPHFRQRSHPQRLNFYHKKI